MAAEMKTVSLEKRNAANQSLERKPITENITMA
jgi:hypothetical protein